MRKIIIASLATLALTLASLPAGADEPRTRSDVGPRGGNDRLLSEPPSLFERPRSLFEFDPRPTRRPIMPLYPTVERELDRGFGRIESDAEFDIRRRQREQDERRGIVPRQREFERFDEIHDRTLRIQRQEQHADQALRNRKLVETESERLAAERARFYKSAGIHVGGAAHDTGQLRDLERAYQQDVKQLRRDRTAELKQLAKNDNLSAETRRAVRAALDTRYRAAQTERRERYAQDRARVLGN